MQFAGTGKSVQGPGCGLRAQEQLQCQYSCASRTAGSSAGAPAVPVVVLAEYRILGGSMNTLTETGRTRLGKHEVFPG